MASTAGVLSLGDHPWSLILRYLTLADQLRLSLACRELCLVARKSVCCLLLGQQELEESDAFSVYPQATHIYLSQVNLDTDIVEFLAANSPTKLRQLASIHIADLRNTDSSALALILRTCTGLTSIQLNGDWQPDPPFEIPDGYPPNVQRLGLQRNVHLSSTDLCRWLIAPNAHTARHQLQCEWQCRPNSHSSRQQADRVWTPLTSGLAFAAAGGDYSLLQQDPAIGGISPAWPHLQELDLSGCSGVGDSWEFFALCPQLRSLRMHSCFKVTSDTLRHVHEVWEDYISEKNSCSSGSACSKLCSSSRCRSPCAATHAQAEAAEAGSSVASPQSVPAVGLNLVQLDLSYTRVNDKGMVHLAHIAPNLQSLSLKGCNVGDDGLLHLLPLSQLTALHIKHCHRITEEGILQLSALTGLRELSYGYTSMPEANEVAAATAHQFKQLTALNFLSSELTDKGLAALGALKDLQCLKLYQAGISCSGLNTFAELPAGLGVSSLVLYGLGGLTSLSCLGAFPHLQDLQLGCLCDLQNIGSALQQLTRVEHLTSLVLERLDGISVSILRRLLVGNSKLNRLRIWGCSGVSQDDMEQLAANSAAWCRSSANIWWTGSSSISTDDEEEADTLLCS